MQQPNLLRHGHAHVPCVIQKSCDAWLLHGDVARSTRAFASDSRDAAGYLPEPPCSYRSYPVIACSCISYWELLQVLHHAWARLLLAYLTYQTHRADQRYPLLFSHSPTQRSARVGSFYLPGMATHQRWWPDARLYQAPQSEFWHASRHDLGQCDSLHEHLERHK